MLPPFPPASASFEALRRDFRWNLPARFNIGTAVSDEWAKRDPGRVALVGLGGEGKPRTLTFGALARRSDRIAAGLKARGVGRGDRVALVLPQGFEAAVTHCAVYKLGAVAVPLALLFGTEGLGVRLRRAGAKAIVTTAAGLRKVEAIAGGLPTLGCVLVTDEPPDAQADFHRLAQDAPDGFEAADTTPDDPAMMIFTSGTTGPPKGALHGHRVLLGHMPGICLAQEGPERPGDLLWTPADWAWAGGLLNALLPALLSGVPVAFAESERFEGEAAFGLMERLGVTNAFLPPTALRMMRAVPDPGRFPLKLRAVGSAGETLGADTGEWARDALNCPVNEFYGQTECNAVVGSATGLGVLRAGAIGKPLPGHAVALLDAEGRPVPPGETGSIAVRRPDPVMFLGYWQDEDATREKFIGDWMLTGDQATADADGFVRFLGRDDDIITSAGYRIGPSEIEDCLAGHPAVAAAAAVGKPDALRTEIVKAYVALKDPALASPALAEAIRLWVRERLSAHEYPREIAFVDGVPLTASGKVIRRLFRAEARAEAGEVSAG